MNLLKKHVSHKNVKDISKGYIYIPKSNYFLKILGRQTIKNYCIFLNLTWRISNAYIYES